MKQDRDDSFSFGAEDQQNDFFPVYSQTDSLNNSSLNMDLPQDKKNDFFPVYTETDSLNNSSLSMDGDPHFGNQVLERPWV
jgi:hypothetical protein